MELSPSHLSRCISGEKKPVTSEQKVGWAPEWVWTFWRRENLLPLSGFEFQHLLHVPDIEVEAS